jgi:hypothetical protein
MRTPNWCPVWLIMLQVRARLAWLKWRTACVDELGPVAPEVTPEAPKKPKRNQPSQQVTMAKRRKQNASANPSKKPKSSKRKTV